MWHTCLFDHDGGRIRLAVFCLDLASSANVVIVQLMISNAYPRE